MENETVNDLVVYLGHCNRKDHIATIMAMVRRLAANEQALQDAHEELSGLRGLVGDRVRRNRSDDRFKEMMSRELP